MFSRFALGDNACRWSNHGKSYEHSTGPKPPAPHVGADAEPRRELRSERIIRRHGSPRLLKLNHFRTLWMLFPGSPLNAWVPIVKGEGPELGHGSRRILCLYRNNETTGLRGIVSDWRLYQVLGALVHGRLRSLSSP